MLMVLLCTELKGVKGIFVIFREILVHKFAGILDGLAGLDVRYPRLSVTQDFRSDGSRNPSREEKYIHEFSA